MRRNDPHAVVLLELLDRVLFESLELGEFRRLLEFFLPLFFASFALLLFDLLLHVIF